MSDAKSRPLSHLAELHLSHYTMGQRCSEEQRQLWAEPHDTNSISEPQAGVLGRCHCILWCWENAVWALCSSWASNPSLHPTLACIPRQPWSQGCTQCFLGWRLLISGDYLNYVCKCTFTYLKPFPQISGLSELELKFSFIRLLKKKNLFLVVIHLTKQQWCLWEEIQANMLSTSIAKYIN